MSTKRKPCVRCGYCCTNYLVSIIVDPEIGYADGNIKSINTLEEKCPHLEGDKPGKYSCKVHHFDWFEDSPCGRFNADGCLLGDYILEKSLKR